jgi:hypothetical protein
MPADPDRFARHGRVRVAEAQTHFSHADGTPFFYLADTAWSGPLLATDADWATYLDDRAAKGFTAIQFIAHAPWTAALTDADGQTAFTNDPARPLNAAFYDRLDRRIEAINARGLLALPVLAWAANFGDSRGLNLGYTHSAAQLIPVIGAQVERLSRHHALLILAGDGVYNFWRSRKWRRVGRAVFGGRADRPPVTMHPAGLTWPFGRFAHEPWLDWYGYQSSHSTSPQTVRWLRTQIPAYLRRLPRRPVINLEPVYEQIGGGRGRRPFDRADVRRACYWSLLNAPTAGVAYGAHGLWGWHDRPMEAVNHTGLGVGPRWDDAMRLPGSDDMARLADCFTAVRWWTLRPDPDLLSQEPPNGRASASRSGDLAVVYVPEHRDVVVRLDQVRHDLQWHWFDPRTGGRTLTEPDGSWGFTPPEPSDATSDWLLIGQQGA